MELIQVEVPFKKEIAYTLYSKGLTVDIPHVSENRDYITFTYPKNSVFILFYEFKTPFKRPTRKTYIVSGSTDKQNINTVSLPGVSNKVQIIYTAKGHKVDDVKRADYLLTQQSKYLIYKLPKMFWYKLAAQIEYFNARKTNFITLYNQYKPKNMKELNYDNN